MILLIDVSKNEDGNIYEIGTTLGDSTFFQESENTLNISTLETIVIHLLKRIRKLEKKEKK